MFNDHLSLDDCRSLVARLAQCVFPFQCAHGRPSMIPVLDLTLPTDQENDHSPLNSARGPFGDEQTLNNTRAELGFVEAFRAWKPPFLEA
jgi:DNA mismatch repair protein MLH3